MEIRIVNASRVLVWFQDGFTLFRREPLVWIVQVVIAFAVGIVLSLVPLIGPFTATVLSTVFAAGFFWTCEQGRNGKPMKIEHLFEGFRRNTTPLMTVGLIYAIGSLIVGAITIAAAIGGGVSPDAMGSDGDNMAMGAVAMLGPLLVVLLALVLVTALVMAVWFASPLVMFDGITPVDAMKMSLLACMKNWLPFLLYSVVLLVLGLVASIPFGLGWLVLIPTLIGAIYGAYRDIFRPDSSADPSSDRILSLDKRR